MRGSEIADYIKQKEIERKKILKELMTHTKITEEEIIMKEIEEEQLKREIILHMNELMGMI